MAHLRGFQAHQTLTDGARALIVSLSLALRVCEQRKRAKEKAERETRPFLLLWLPWIAGTARNFLTEGLKPKGLDLR